MTFTHRPFNPEHDKAVLQLFCQMRGEKLDNFDFLPPSGLIVFHEEAPVCIGFLIKCDNKVAIHSDFLSDPELSKELRNQGVEYMRSVFAEEAKREGYRAIVAFTKHKKLAKRLTGLGFRLLDQGFFQVGRFLWL